MKLRGILLGAATIAMCSSSVAFADDAVRPSTAHPIAKSSLKVSRASATLRDTNKDGSTAVPIAVAAVAAAGVGIYFATKHDDNASR